MARSKGQGGKVVSAKARVPIERGRAVGGVRGRVGREVEALGAGRCY